MKRILIAAAAAIGLCASQAHAENWHEMSYSPRNGAFSADLDSVWFGEFPAAAWRRNSKPLELLTVWVRADGIPANTLWAFDCKGSSWTVLGIRDPETDNIKMLHNVREVSKTMIKLEPGTVAYEIGTRLCAAASLSRM